jgi:hypothetical protein
MMVVLAASNCFDSMIGIVGVDVLPVLMEVGVTMLLTEARMEL